MVVSSALDTSVGLHYGGRLHQILSANQPHILDAGLGTASFLEGDVVKNPLRASAGWLQLSPVELEPELLQHYAMTEDRRDWWRGRLERCLELL